MGVHQGSYLTGGCPRHQLSSEGKNEGSTANLVRVVLIDSAPACWAALKLRRHWPTVASVLQSEVPSLRTNGGLKDAKANLLADGS